MDVASMRTGLAAGIIVAPVEDRLRYDIGLPITKPMQRYDVHKLSRRDGGPLEAIFDRAELAEPCRAQLRAEFATTRADAHQAEAAGAVRPAQELLACITHLVANRLRSPNRFADLYPVVRDYVQTCCFGRDVDLEDERVRSHLAQPEMREGIAGYLAPKIVDMTVNPRAVEFDRQDFRLSETKPFRWRHDLPPLEARKTVFNLVATYNSFERSFAEFLDRAPDVTRFAALGTTEQGASGTVFRVDYVKASGAIGFYSLDWVVVERLRDEDWHWIIETKGRVWEGTERKDAAMREWCRRVSRVTGKTWKYLRVNQPEFDANRETFRMLVMAIVGAAVRRRREGMTATVSQAEIRQWRDEGRM